MDLSPQAVEFGAAMRDMRVAHGRELAEVAETLRIRLAFLQAIEDGRFHDLPGPAYAGGFVRAYADYLGLDVPEVMRRYREASGPDGAGAQSALVPPSPMAEGRMPTGFILLVAVILGALIYGGWYYLTLHGRDAGEVVSDLPRQLAEMVGMRTQTEPTPSEVVVPPAEPRSAPDEPRTSDSPAALSPPATVAPAAPEPVPQPPPEPAPAARTEAVSTRQPEPVPAPPAATPPAPAPSPVVEAPAPQPEPAPVVRTVPDPAPEPAAVVRVAPQPAAERAPEPAAERAPEPAPEPVPEPAPEPTMAMPAPENPPAPAETAQPVPPAPNRMAAIAESAGAAGRVVLRATSASWVELRDPDNRRVFSQVMRAGETYTVPAGRPIMLTTGNAGGLDILVDGQPIPSLGPVGDVRRNISLEPEALLSRLQR